ncbi:MAG: LysR family transcriptional regulator [Colwellia sp.]
MNLQQIKYFLAVVDTGTFLAAAKQVYVTQPTLSAGIKSLEDSLGVILFHRGSRNAVLTSKGEQFLHTARNAYNQLINIKSELTEPAKKIDIGVLSTVHMDHVAQIVEQFRNIYPHILIKFSVANSTELSAMLKAHQLDLTITNNHSLHDEENFTGLIKEELCLVVSHKHPLVSERSVALKVLHQKEFIERVSCTFWQSVNNLFEEQSILPNTILQIEQDEFVLPLVAANVGVSIMTNRNTPYDVKFISISDFEINREIGVCLSTDKRSEHVDAFIETIFRQYKK